MALRGPPALSPAFTPPGGSRFAAVVRLRPPAELVAQGLVEVMARNLDQLEGHGRPPDRDPVPRGQGEHVLSVNDESGGLGPRTHRDSVYLVGGVHNGARGERVRADGGDDERLKLLPEDRPARR